MFSTKTMLVALVVVLSSVCNAQPPVGVTCGLVAPPVCTVQMTYVDPTNNRGYYECGLPLGFPPVWHDCGFGYLYDCCQPVGCHPALETKCPGGVVPKRMPRRQNARAAVTCLYAGEFIPDPVDCGLYYECNTALYPDPRQCPGGLYFDVYTDSCLSPIQVACVGGARPPIVK